MTQRATEIKDTNELPFQNRNGHISQACPELLEYRTYADVFNDLRDLHQIHETGCHRRGLCRRGQHRED